MIASAPLARASAGGEPPRAAPSILEALRAVPGITFTEEQTEPSPDARFFLLGFEQPTDHRSPEGGKFVQRLSLLFRSEAAPLVMASSGYGLIPLPIEAEPTTLFGVNQLVVEHRFYGTSVPDPLDWTKLSVFQVASDHHRVVQALRQVFRGRWLSLGASSGAMDVLYHRILFPDDVDGTLAYSVSNSYGLGDTRYAHFLERVGSSGCRDALKTFQRTLLERRGAIMSRMKGAAAELGDGYETLGLHRAFELAVIELPFVFWQFSDASLCPEVPGREASDDALFAFLEQVYRGVIYAFGDQASAYFAPWYYQSATELGWPALPQAHLLDLLDHPVDDQPQRYLPFDVLESFRWAAMPMVQAAVFWRGQRILFLYGENDPWSAGAILPCIRECPLFIVPRGNHTANLSSLPEPERRRAIATIARWLDMDSR